MTHSVNMDQRYVALDFEGWDQGFNTLMVSAPAGPALAPPGYYMLFLVDSDGVPSVASMVQVGG